MPALQNLVLKDRKSTPVDHTFVPADVSGGVGRLVETTGVKLGESSYTISCKPNATKSRYKASAKLTIPIVENAVINGITVPTVVRTSIVTIEASFDAASSRAERNDVIGMIQDSLTATKTLVDKTFVDLEGVYGA